MLSLGLAAWPSVWRPGPGKQVSPRALCKGVGVRGDHRPLLPFAGWIVFWWRQGGGDGTCLEIELLGQPFLSLDM